METEREDRSRSRVIEGCSDDDKDSNRVINASKEEEKEAGEEKEDGDNDEASYWILRLRRKYVSCFLKYFMHNTNCKSYLIKFINHL